MSFKLLEQRGSRGLRAMGQGSFKEVALAVVVQSQAETNCGERFCEATLRTNLESH